ncbi:MAG: dihydropteroate synthase [Micavibrio aeruginosavorus]|uniref:Dihydropteroate synthase n=1 Tax=Micavibrio aeruginosavorus TaxID=349221 RepID=A0A2W5A4N9_9BACT|nr:MAG: dihydropteroate synthase [Micavibrio aeruginosavorus]
MDASAERGGAYVPGQGFAAGAGNRRSGGWLERIAMETSVIMGIVNVTPDSFSDGGRYFDPALAIAHGLRLRDEGADILDIGGESTRPGSDPVSVEEELARVVPVIKGLKQCGAILSIDTRRAAVMKAALAEGVRIVNDVSALTFDPDAMGVVADSGVDVCLMHMKGDPKTMQDAPHYDDVFTEVYEYLEDRVRACADAGIRLERIMIDPGIGFAKNLSHNLTLLNRIGEFRALGVRVMLGASRKRFIENICPGTAADDRLPGSLAACIAAYMQDIRHFRVHDVAETVQALAVYDRIRSA